MHIGIKLKFSEAFPENQHHILIVIHIHQFIHIT